LVALNRMDISCAQNNTCSKKTGGFQLVAGAKLPSAYALDLNPVMIDTVEVGLSKFGRVEAQGLTPVRYYLRGRVALKNVPTKNSITANALHASLVARFGLADDLSMNAKVGRAYVSTTSQYSEDGVSNGGVTENHFAPLLGINAEYTLMDELKLTAGLEATRFKAAGQSGTVKALTFGALISY
jgi:hypothetical protein